MKNVSTFADFLSTVTPYLTLPQPLPAMRAAGIVFSGEVEAALERSHPASPIDPSVLPALEKIYGPPPKLNVNVAQQAAPEAKRPAAPLATGGFRAVASATVAPVNDLLAELWRVKVIPDSIAPDVAAAAITIADLEANCSGVPAGASIGDLLLTAPPLIRASAVSTNNVQFDVTFTLSILAAQPSQLTGTVHVQMPLDFQTFLDANGKERLWPSQNAIDGLTATLDVDASSQVQPRSAGNAANLAQIAGHAASAVLFNLVFVRNILTIPAEVPLPHRFPDSKVTISQAGAVTVRSNGTDYIIAGINVQNTQIVDANQLINVPLPTGANNIHAEANDDFAGDVLSALITSHGLEKYINGFAERHSPINVYPILVKGGQASVNLGTIDISIDCEAQGFCAFGTDLDFTATVSGSPSLANGTLTIDSSDMDFDLDNWDTFVCTITGALTGPFGLMLYVGMMGFLAAYNPSPSDPDYASSDSSGLLPNSEKYFNVSLTYVDANPRSLTADGVAALLSDTTDTFAYLRIVSGTSIGTAQPLKGATVELLELDSPAPAGDDVLVPATGETVVKTGKFLIDTVTSYEPLADQVLSTQVTDNFGFARFVGVVNRLGGIFTTNKSWEKFDGTVMSQNTTTKLIGETKPDYGITVKDASGNTLASRQLITLNTTGTHLGSPDEPLVVLVPGAA
jgi:hypothetical protein